MKAPSGPDAKGIEVVEPLFGAVIVSQLENATVKAGSGCRTCRNTGYKGRKGIFEIFKIDQEVSHLINQNETTPKLRRRARELGMRTLREDGIRKVLSGLTTASEVVRVTMSDSD